VTDFNVIEIIAWTVGLISAFLIARNQVTQQKGMGPRTIQGLTISLGIPLLLTLALEKILTGETIAALVGSLLGIGIQKEKE
jgi:hypothetical protein